MLLNTKVYAHFTKITNNVILQSRMKGKARNNAFQNGFYDVNLGSKARKNLKKILKIIKHIEKYS